MSTENNIIGCTHENPVIRGLNSKECHSFEGRDNNVPVNFPYGVRLRMVDLKQMECDNRGCISHENYTGPSE